MPMTKKDNRLRDAELKRRVEQEKRKESALGLGVILIIVIAIAAGAYYFALPSLSTSSSPSSFSANLSSYARDLTSSSPAVLGSSNAPVTIVEFGDFQCPSCGAWFRTQEQEIIQNLIQIGRAKLVWRDFDYYGPDSTLASEAAYAAGEQGKFWQYHDLLYSNQQAPNSGWASKDNLLRFAQQLGLDTTMFRADLDSGKYQALINSNFDLGQKLGVNGTPTFFVVGSNGNVITIVGPQPFSVFETAVNQVVAG